ncbi:hypothetical protein ACFQ9X_39660 [Catenulispora yoronensis]
MTLYALIVGIDDYQPPTAGLHGARRDALAVEAHLRARIPDERLSLLRLTDTEATRAALLAGFRKHLGQAGPGDTALFWFSGRGSAVPLPRSWRTWTWVARSRPCCARTAGRDRCPICWTRRSRCWPPTSPPPVRMWSRSWTPAVARASRAAVSWSATGAAETLRPGPIVPWSAIGATAAIGATGISGALGSAAATAAAAAAATSAAAPALGSAAATAAAAAAATSAAAPIPVTDIELFLDGTEPERVEIGDASTVRWTPPAPEPPSADALLAELRQVGGPDSPRAAGLSAAPVLLTACGPHEPALELRIGGAFRGVFTTALLDRLSRQPAATYRRLLDDTRDLVRLLAPGQRPALVPAAAVPGGGPADLPFLGGPARIPPSRLTMHHRNRVWTVDAGAAHGLVAGPAADPTVVAVVGSRPVRQARVVEVRAEHSVLEPIGWPPDALDRRASHSVVLARVPLPAEPVRLETAAAGEYVAPLIIRTLAVAGPGGTPSPYVRVLDPGDRGRPPTVRVRALGPGMVQLCRADGGPVAVPRPCRSAQQAARIVAELEHIARWRLVAGLDNPVSRLAGAVRVELAAVRTGQAVDRLQDPPLPLLPDGTLTVNYRRLPDGGWQAPLVFVRLRSTADRMLYCALLHLTDRFGLHTDLFPGSGSAPATPSRRSAGGRCG